MKKFTADLSVKCELNEAVGKGTHSLTVLPNLAKKLLHSSVIMV